MREERTTSFKDLVESRKQEMEFILPGFMTIVKDPQGKKKEVKVYSPSVMKRSLFKISNED